MRRALLLLAAALAWPAAGRADVTTETQLLAVVTSAAPVKERMDACRELARVGTAASVPALADLLGDTQLCHMARFALEPIPDPAVDAAFREALARLHGSQAAGVAISVGMRRDRKAVPQLGTLLADADDRVAEAAAHALARIADGQAADTLSRALAASTGTRFGVIGDACLHCADLLAANDDQRAAAKLFRSLRSLSPAGELRDAASRGVIVCGGKDGLALLELQLEAKDAREFSAAVRGARDRRDAAVSRKLADALSSLAPERQQVVLEALAVRKDADSAAALLRSAASSTGDVQVAAIRLLGRSADPRGISLLARAIASDDAACAEAASVALAGYRSADADRAIAGLLGEKDARTRVAGIRLVTQRRLVSQLPTLLALARDTDSDVESASLKALADLGRAEDVPSLVELVVARDAKPAAISALGAVCARLARQGGTVVIRRALYGDLPTGRRADVTKKVAAQVAEGARSITASNEAFGDAAPGTVKKLSIAFEVDGLPGERTVAEGDALMFPEGALPSSCVEALLRGQAAAPAASRLALLRIASSSADPRILATVREAAGTGDGELREGAQRLLCEWPRAEALPDVRSLATSAADAKVKVLAARAVVRLAVLPGVTAAARGEALREAAGVATRGEERLQMVAAVRGLPVDEALPILMPWLQDPQVRAEAALAVVEMAEANRGALPPQLRAALEVVRGLEVPPGLVARAAKLLPTEVWTALFNGHDLDGWAKQGDAVFRVDDGCILGTQTDGKGGDLFTTNRWSDFELCFRYRMKWPGNSGVWFRDQYQFDILKYANPVAFSGTLYCPGKLFLFRNPDEALEKRDDWNEGRIVAAGDHLAIWLNGKQAGEARDAAWKSGRIGIQVHPGNDAKGMEIRIKDIRIRPVAGGN